MKEYEKLKKKYKLPDYKVLDNEFEILTIEAESFLLRNIRKRMSEKLDFFSKLLEEQLQPEASLPVIHECRFIEDEDKLILFESYKKLMYLVRKSSRLAVINDEKADVDYIKESLDAWQKLKKPLQSLLQKFEDAWTKSVPAEEELRYFG